MKNNAINKYKITLVEDRKCLCGNCSKNDTISFKSDIHIFFFNIITSLNLIYVIVVVVGLKVNKYHTISKFIETPPRFGRSIDEQSPYWLKILIANPT